MVLLVPMPSKHKHALPNTRAALLHLVLIDAVRHLVKECELDEIANNYCHINAFVPHCHCNSIELMRAQVKSCNAKRSSI
jgi:hypothetical protein